MVLPCAVPWVVPITAGLISLRLSTAGSVVPAMVVGKLEYTSGLLFAYV